MGEPAVGPDRPFNSLPNQCAPGLIPGAIFLSALTLR